MRPNLSCVGIIAWQILQTPGCIVLQFTLFSGLTFVFAGLQHSAGSAAVGQRACFVSHRLSTLQHLQVFVGPYLLDAERTGFGDHYKAMTDAFLSLPLPFPGTAGAADPPIFSGDSSIGCRARA